MTAPEVDAGTPFVDPTLAGRQRIPLSPGAWLDHLPGWVQHHDEIFRTLRDELPWRTQTYRREDRVVTVPRLIASPGEADREHPALQAIARALGAHYGLPVLFNAATLYRDGGDRVQHHGDLMREHRMDTVVSIVSFGASRPLRMRPARGGPEHEFRLGQGDLLVMGGDCQATWVHGVPETGEVDARISLLFRPERYPPDWSSFDDAPGGAAPRVDRPLPAYLENYPGLPVGARPHLTELTGKARWNDWPPGRVLGLVGEQEGHARIDLDGDGRAADPRRLAEEEGIDEEEAASVAVMGPPGSSVLRFRPGCAT